MLAYTSKLLPPYISTLFQAKLWILHPIISFLPCWWGNQRWCFTPNGCVSFLVLPPHAAYRSAITVACVYRNNSRKAVGARHTHCFGRVRCQWSCPFPADSPPHMCNSQNPPLSLCWSGLWSFSCGRQHLRSWVRGLVARRKQQQVDRARQTTAPWQRASCFYRVTSSPNLGHVWGRENILE